MKCLPKIIFMSVNLFTFFYLTRLIGMANCLYRDLTENTLSYIYICVADPCISLLFKHIRKMLYF